MELKEFKKKLDSIDENAIDEFIAKVLLEVGKKAWADVKENTPYKEGYLRNAWSLSSVKKVGEVFEIELTNSKKYAKWVEYGHSQEVGRFVPAIGKRLKKGWVEGKFMLTITMEEIEKEFKNMLIKEQKKFLLKKLKGK